MLFSNDNMTLELTGIFSIKRSKCKKQSIPRQYDSISIRISGEAEFYFDGNKVLLKENDLLYLPQNSVYEQETDSENIIAIHFINYNHTEKSKPEIIKAENPEYLRELVIKMYNLWTLKEPGYKYECTSLLYHLLYELRKCNGTDENSVTSDTLIENAVSYIHKHYKTETIYISELAKKVSLSEVYFRKVFKKIYSVSPNRYINNLRLEYAAQLLQSGLYSVSEVAEISGFNDVKYFTKCFKNKHNMTPKAYITAELDKLFSQN